jgi:hypothetical protein
MIKNSVSHVANSQFTKHIVSSPSKIECDKTVVLTISPFLFEAQIMNDRKKLQVASLQMPQM